MNDTELTDTERWLLDSAIEASGEIIGLTDGLAAAVEHVLAARVAAARADAWDEGQTTTIADHGDTCHRAYRLSDNPYRAATEGDTP